MLLVIDNYDSFTFNLVQLLGQLGEDPMVLRNDDRSVAEIAALAPRAIVVSPGPGTPATAGVSVDVIRRLGGEGTPVLGVCLGHQCLGEAFGGRTIRAHRTMHGKTGPIRHTGEGLFRGLPESVNVARYHSLVTDASHLPDVLLPMAWSTDEADEGEIQAMRHQELPLWGVQFHPESLFSAHGGQLLSNFLEL
ncbi:MAG: aminodeoxychorismate/anthranilate synthase component II [Gemmatimonadota bacterium]|nr:aminodeoxychorismate/anthranilate synthase component II [Gemmatimonadota bacterium]